MYRSWPHRWMKKSSPQAGRKARRCVRRRHGVLLAIEGLEERCLLSGGPLGDVANGLHIFGNYAGLLGNIDAYTTTPNTKNLGDLLGSFSNFYGSILSSIPGASTQLVGQSITTAGDITTLASDMLFGTWPPTQGTVLDAISGLSAVAGDLNGLAGGSPIVSDSLAITHDFSAMLNDLDNGSKFVGDVSNLAGDVVGLIGDLLGGDAGKQPLQVSVGGAGPFGILTNSEMTQGANYFGPVASFSDPNVSQAKPGDYSALINWGDGSVTPGQIDANLNIIGSHTYTQAGNYQLSVVVTGDGTQGQSTAEITVKSNLANVSDGAGFAVAVGQPIVNGEVASFNTWAFGSQDQNAYSATINWGDGTTSAGQIMYGGTAGFMVEGTHAYSQPGSFSITTQINAPNGETASANTTANVLSPDQAIVIGSTPQNISPTVGQRFTGIVANFTDYNGDSNPSDFQATIDWGDGSTSPAQLVAAGNGSLDVVGSHTYAQIGQYEMSVDISDNAGGGGTSVLPTATVGPFDLTVNPISAAAGQTFSGTLATLTAPPGTTAGDYSAEIFWGDSPLYAPPGGNPPGQIVDNGNGTFSILGSHTYPGSGTYSIRLSVEGPNGVLLQAGGTATVGSNSLMVTGQDLALSPSPSANVSQADVRAAVAPADGSVNGIVATFTAPSGAVADKYTALIYWGDGNSTTGQIVANANGSFNVLGSHTYSQRGNYLTTVQVSDNNGNIASASGTVSPPHPTSSVNPLPATEISPSFTVRWSGSDPNGSSIASYTIYVSDNGGPFTSWLANTTQTSAIYTGQVGHTYGFYSVATDGLGISQPTPTAAQATTFVQLPSVGNPGGDNDNNNNNVSTTNNSDQASSPAPPNVSPLLAFLNGLLGAIETVNANGTTITDSLFGIPLVENYDYSGSLLSVTLFGFNITFLFE
ncbi:MAG TPA: hypothetical protein VE999_22610 [Gemmataceae bacterium]|nr:hypothetical protein [Gemmataceae bacterium]